MVKKARSAMVLYVQGKIFSIHEECLTIGSIDHQSLLQSHWFIAKPPKHLNLGVWLWTSVSLQLQFSEDTCCHYNRGQQSRVIGMFSSFETEEAQGTTSSKQYDTSFGSRLLKETFRWLIKSHWFIGLPQNT